MARQKEKIQPLQIQFEAVSEGLQEQVIWVSKAARKPEGVRQTPNLNLLYRQGKNVQLFEDGIFWKMQGQSLSWYHQKEAAHFQGALLSLLQNKQH